MKEFSLLITSLPRTCLLRSLPTWQALKGEGEGGIWAREGKEGNACKETIVFSIFHAQIDSERENSDWSELIKCQSST